MVGQLAGLLVGLLAGQVAGGWSAGCWAGWSAGRPYLCQESLQCSNYPKVKPKLGLLSELRQNGSTLQGSLLVQLRNERVWSDRM